MDEMEIKKKELQKRIEAAKKIAEKEGIKPNTIVINSRYARVNQMLIGFDWNRKPLPALVCGMAAYNMPQANLPAGVEFVVLEAENSPVEAAIIKGQVWAIRELAERLRKVAIISRRDGGYLGFKEADILSIIAGDLIDELPLKIKEVSE
jgi:hypothetical protein